jgi:hypothetical protein
MTRLPRRAPARTGNGAAVLVLVVLAATVLGGWRAAQHPVPHPGAATLAVGHTSYTVTHVDQVQGLSQQDLGGMAHGVQSLVSDDKALITVSLTVTAGDHATTVDPGVLSAVAVGSPLLFLPAGGTLAKGHLSAHARVEGTVSFVVPRKSERFVLRARGQARSVPLIRVTTDAPSAGPTSEPSPAVIPNIGPTSVPSRN